MSNKNTKDKETGSTDVISNISESYNVAKWKRLGKNEGGGSRCCGKNMIMAESGIVYYCVKCDNWEYSDS